MDVTALCGARFEQYTVVQEEFPVGYLSGRRPMPNVDLIWM